MCGFTNYYTAVCWYGFDQNESINYNGQNPAGLIWASVMDKIHLNLPSSKFKISNGVVSLNICEDSKMISNSNCKNTYVEYFLKGTEPEKCIIH